MLRFIRVKEGEILLVIEFQYIPCYGLSSFTRISLFPIWIFQYIPCYGLSVLMLFQFCTHLHFNTSHVTVYRGTAILIGMYLVYFNTSHVTVYLLPVYPLHAFLPYFNTSHVTVYPVHAVSFFKQQMLFQYIPCYGLSLSVANILYPWQAFQYIPCYGLSPQGKMAKMSIRYFNTSHVTVYHAWYASYISQKFISIHPMLRFIYARDPSRAFLLLISIHPMLRFIGYVFYS